jgi:nitroimidazol reductase NimA-like FMN-containing flavoprotein (pyridoxamine 5'-phosphate oxidase superfamily)
MRPGSKGPWTLRRFEASGDHEVMSVDASGLEMLSEPEALALLATVSLGRIVYSDRALPFVSPVSFGLDGQDIVIRTGRRSNLAIHGPGNVVAFQVDDIVVSTGSGWTVVVTGRLQLVHDALEIARLSALELQSWAPAASDRYLQLRPELITGRRIDAQRVD